MDFNVFMKFPDGCGDKSGKVVKLDKSVYGLKQTGRRWAMHLGDVIVRKIGMEQCKADPCEFRLIRDRVVVMIVCVHVDDITVAGESEACDFMSTCLLEEFQTTAGELSSYLGCAFVRDKKESVLRASHRVLSRTGPCKHTSTEEHPTRSHKFPDIRTVADHVFSVSNKSSRNGVLIRIFLRKKIVFQSLFFRIQKSRPYI